MVPYPSFTQKEQECALEFFNCSSLSVSFLGFAKSTFAGGLIDGGGFSRFVDQKAIRALLEHDGILLKNVMKQYLINMQTAFSDFVQYENSEVKNFFRISPGVQALIQDIDRLIVQNILSTKETFIEICAIRTVSASTRIGHLFDPVYFNHSQLAFLQKIFVWSQCSRLCRSGRPFQMLNMLNMSDKMNPLGLTLGQVATNEDL